MIFGAHAVVFSKAPQEAREILNTVLGGRVVDASWGRVTAISLPGGGEIGLYQPRHPTAFERPTMKKTGSAKKAGGKKKAAR